MQKKESKQQFSIGLMDLGTIFTLLVPIVYSAGWAFAYNYFQNFHLGLMGLEIQKEYIFLYGFLVFREQWALSIGIVVFIVIVYLGARRVLKKSASGKSKVSKQHRNVIQSISLFLIPIIALLVFKGYYALGERTADILYGKLIRSDYSSYPRVKVWLTKEAKAEVGGIAEEWEGGCYRLLLRNKERLYIFYPEGDEGKSAIEIIPQSQVRLVRILPLYKTTEECEL